MKKLMILTALVVVGVLACTSWKKSFTGAAQPPIDDSLTCNEAGCPIKLPEAGSNDIVQDVISEDNWQLTLSGSGWASVQSPDDTIKVIFTNQESGAIIFFAKDPTQQTSTQYIIDALRSFPAAETTIKSAKQVSINGTNYVLVTAQGTSRFIWTWITVQQGFGYVFTCAVDSIDAGDTDLQRCQDIANTLQIQ